MNDKEIFQLIKSGNPSEIESALKNGQIDNVNLAEDGMGTTLLITAVCLERIQAVELLLEYDADPNQQDVYGKTALHLLPERQPIEWTNIENKVQIAKLLFQYEANLTIVDQYGGQPLWYSIFYLKKPEDLELVDTYLKHGADPNFKNNGESALDKAEKLQYPPLINLLEKYIK